MMDTWITVIARGVSAAVGAMIASVLMGMLFGSSEKQILCMFFIGWIGSLMWVVLTTETVEQKDKEKKEEEQ